ncbi:MFS transporter [Leucobacter sp. gxy201]|uniref:MFS transporter n=1 Tax=Leucobacter sp. gxy201 TaxID=2957200 RepID=UPI003D9FF048
MPSRSSLLASQSAPTLVLLCLGFNLRLGITGASPLLGELQADGALSPLSATVVTSAPVFVFAIAGLAVLPLLGRWGIRTTMTAALSLLTLGLAVRAVPHEIAIVAGTICAAAGISAVNIILPALVREWCAGRTHRATTGYTSAMALGAAVAAAIALPMARIFGLPTVGLAIWALPSLAAGVLWISLTRSQSQSALALPLKRSGSPTRDRAAASGANLGWPRGTFPMLGFFALQTVLSYTIIGWLPLIAADGGIDDRRAGVMLGIVMAVGIPSTALAVPAAARHATRVLGITITTACAVAGATGLLSAPTAAPEAWAVLLGIGMSGFPFALALLSSIGEDHVQVARVSALTQVVGYFLGGIGSLSAGWVAASSGAWSSVIAVMILGALTQGTLGVALSIALRPARRRPRPRPRR